MQTYLQKRGRLARNGRSLRGKEVMSGCMIKRHLQ